MYKRDVGMAMSNNHSNEIQTLSAVSLHPTLPAQMMQALLVLSWAIV